MKKVSDYYSYYFTIIISLIFLSGIPLFIYGQYSTGTVTDIDGNVYKTIKIGSQWWMAENLNVAHYRNGDQIPNITDNFQWLKLSTGAFSNYDNDTDNTATYGKLYNWYAVYDSRNIAPVGWHVPTDEEWKQLEMYLGMNRSALDATGFRGTDEGSKLAGRASLWYRGKLKNNAAFEESGLSALPGGGRNEVGKFGDLDLGHLAYFWSSSESSDSYAWTRHLDCYHSDVGRHSYEKRSGFSVRCVRD